jgi:hypothetical protein
MRKLLVRVVAGFILLNGLLILGALLARRRLPTYGDEDSDTFAVVAAMDGVEFTSRAEALRAGSATAVAGGIEIDLTRAHLAGTATLDLTAIAGGIEVVIPADWRVEMTSQVLAGGTSNRTDASGDDAPVLLVDARAYFGGIEVRARRDQAIRSAPE